MSSIVGKGYGDKHDWERKDTYQSPLREERGTLFICRKCKESFRHYYHMIPDIFEAMKHSNVSEECE